MAGSSDQAAQWALNYDNRATTAIMTAQRLGNSLRHYSDLIVTAGYNHALADYQADINPNKGPIPDKPSTAIVTVHQEYTNPPAAGGPGKGLDTIIPTLLAQVGPVPDGDTGKIANAHAIWTGLSTSEAVSQANTTITNTKNSISQINSPEINDLCSGLDNLASVSNNLHTASGNLAKECGTLHDEHDAMRRKIADTLKELVEQIEMQILISIAFTFVSAGVGALLDTAVAVKFAKNITIAAAAIKAIVSESKIAQIFADGAKAEDAVANSEKALSDLDQLSEQTVGKDAAQASDGTPELTDEGFAAKYGTPGNWKYPTDYAVAGTQKTVDLPPGTQLDRYGEDTGGWLAPQGTPLGARSLPPDTLSTQTLHGYATTGEPLPPGWKIEESQVAPWFGEPGGGIQYRILDENGNTGDVARLVRAGYLREVTP